jgi:hypothetical protein
LLSVDVVREVPEAAKPRKIGTTVDTVQPQVMEQKAAYSPRRTAPSER